MTVGVRVRVGGRFGVMIIVIIKCRFRLRLRRRRRVRVRGLSWCEITSI